MALLTLSMIVKNEEKYLKECLESVKGVVDDIVIVDTGSTDNTISIATKFNARILRFDWINDFSAARNYALKNSAGNWILYLDADERLDPTSINELKKIIQTSENAGYYCTVKSVDDENGRDHTIRYVRLFKNNSGIKFTGKVHEQIVPSLEINNYCLYHSSIQINHIGYNVSKDEKEKKAVRNLELLQKDYEQEEAPYIAFQLGQTYYILNRLPEAEKFFKIAAENKDIPNNLKAESLAYLAHIMHINFETESAEAYLSKAIDLNAKQAYYYLLLSKISLRKQDYTKAKFYCQKANELNKSNMSNLKTNAQTVLINPREILYFGLYLSYQSNDHDSTDYFITELYKVIKNDNYQEKISLIKAMESILKGRELTEEIGAAMLKYIDRNNIDLFLAGIMKQKSDSLKISLLEKLLKKFSKNSEVIKNLSVIYDQSNRTTKAIEILEQNRELMEKDAGAMFYLASYYLKAGKIKESLNMFTYVEEQFQNIKEIQPKVKAIKERLLSLINTSN